MAAKLAVMGVRRVAIGEGWRPDSLRWLGALRRFYREVQRVSHPGQVGQRRRLHLSPDLAAMDFYGDLADPDVGSGGRVLDRVCATIAFSFSSHARSRSRPIWSHPAGS
jgi:hypothetical protein